MCGKGLINEKCGMILGIQEEKNPLTEFVTLEVKTKNFSEQPIFIKFSNKE